MELDANLTRENECFTDACHPESIYRTFSGCCNNVANRFWGSAFTQLDRLLTNEYADGFSIPRGGIDPSNLPSPRNVSTTIIGVEETDPRPPISLMIMQYGQFLDHDLSLTPEQGWYNPEI